MENSFIKTNTFVSWIFVVATLALVSLCFFIIIFFKPSSDVTISTNHNLEIEPPKSLLQSNYGAEIKNISPLKSVSLPGKDLEPMTNNPPAQTKDSFTDTKRLIGQIDDIANQKNKSGHDKSQQVLAIMNAHLENSEVVSEAVRILAMNMDVNNISPLLELAENSRGDVLNEVIDALANQIVDINESTQNPVLNPEEQQRYENISRLALDKINKVYFSPDTSLDNKKQIEARYNDFNPSTADITNISRHVLSRGELSDNELLFLQQVLYNPNAAYSEILGQIKTLPSTDQAKIATALSEQSSLLADDEIKKIPREQVTILQNFIGSQSVYHSY